jgi:hypothetical protein
MRVWWRMGVQAMLVKARKCSGLRSWRRCPVAVHQPRLRPDHIAFDGQLVTGCQCRVMSSFQQDSVAMGREQQICLRVEERERAGTKVRRYFRWAPGALRDCRSWFCWGPRSRAMAGRPVHPAAKVRGRRPAAIDGHLPSALRGLGHPEARAAADGLVPGMR